MNRKIILTILMLAAGLTLAGCDRPGMGESGNLGQRTNETERESANTDSRGVQPVIRDSDVRGSGGIVCIDGMEQQGFSEWANSISVNIGNADSLFLANDAEVREVNININIRHNSDRSSPVNYDTWKTLDSPEITIFNEK